MSNYLRYRGHGFANGGHPTVPITAETTERIFQQLEADNPPLIARLLASPAGATLVAHHTNEGTLAAEVFETDPTIPDGLIDFTVDGEDPVLCIRKVRHNSITAPDYPAIGHWAHHQIDAGVHNDLHRWMDYAPDGVIVRLDDGRYLVREGGVWHAMTMVQIPGELDTSTAPVSIASQVFVPVAMTFGTDES